MKRARRERRLGVLRGSVGARVRCSLTCGGDRLALCSLVNYGRRRSRYVVRCERERRFWLLVHGDATPRGRRLVSSPNRLFCGFFFFLLSRLALPFGRRLCLRSAGTLAPSLELLRSLFGGWRREMTRCVRAAWTESIAGSVSRCFRGGTPVFDSECIY